MRTLIAALLLVVITGCATDVTKESALQTADRFCNPIEDMKAKGECYKAFRPSVLAEQQRQSQPQPQQFRCVTVRIGQFLDTRCQ